MTVFIEDENYELEVVIKKVTQEEVAKAKKFAKKSNYESPFEAINSGLPANTAKLYFHPDFQEYCPV